MPMAPTARRTPHPMAPTTRWTPARWRHQHEGADQRPGYRQRLGLPVKVVKKLTTALREGTPNRRRIALQMVKDTLDESSF